MLKLRVNATAAFLEGFSMRSTEVQGVCWKCSVAVSLSHVTELLYRKNGSRSRRSYPQLGRNGEMNDYRIKYQGESGLERQAERKGLCREGDLGGRSRGRSRSC